MTTENEAIITRLGQEIDRLNIELIVTGRAVETEHQQVVNLGSALLREQARSESLQERVAILTEREQSDKNEIHALTTELRSVENLIAALRAMGGAA